MADSLPTLVTGATGQQGGAVARHLLAAGRPVRALTRDPGKPAARALADLGAEVVAGDLDDADSVRRALSGAGSVFSVQQFFEAGYDGEVRQGSLLVDLAVAAGVGHLVYSSVGSADTHTGIPHFDSKAEVEAHVRASGIPATILRPTAFMESRDYLSTSLAGGELRTPLSPDRTLQQISVEDIGGVAALALSDPERWIGRAVDLAGDELTSPQKAELAARVLGHPVSVVRVSWEEFRESAGEEFTVMMRWFQDVGYRADIAALRAEYPALRSFEADLTAGATV